MILSLASFWIAFSITGQAFRNIFLPGPGAEVFRRPEVKYLRNCPVSAFSIVTPGVDSVNGTLDKATAATASDVGH